MEEPQSANFVHLPQLTQAAWTSVGCTTPLSEENVKALTEKIYTATKGSLPKKTIARGLELTAHYGDLKAPVSQELGEKIQAILDKAEGLDINGVSLLATLSLYNSLVPGSPYVISAIHKTQGEDGQSTGLTGVDIKNDPLTNLSPPTVSPTVSITEALSKSHAKPELALGQHLHDAIKDICTTAEYGWMVKISKIYLFKRLDQQEVTCTFDCVNMRNEAISIFFKMKDGQMILRTTAVPEKAYLMPLSPEQERDLNFTIRVFTNQRL